MRQATFIKACIKPHHGFGEVAKSEINMNTDTHTHKLSIYSPAFVPAQYLPCATVRSGDNNLLSKVPLELGNSISSR